MGKPTKSTKKEAFRVEISTFVPFDTVFTQLPPAYHENS